jgi:aryl-alcohol dehydrogenase-like predicted oxidoreductase
MNQRELGRTGLRVSAIGLGCMGMSEFYGRPDEGEAILTLHRALELGVTLLDTADMYGRGANELLLGKALAGRREQAVVATKLGIVRTDDKSLRVFNGKPEYVKEACDASLRRLGITEIDLYQLHRIDPRVPAAESLGTLAELRDEGKIRHVGLSEVGVEEIRQAREIVPIASVQNRYNLTDRGSEDVLDFCEREGIGFIPWFPLAVGDLARPGGPLDEIAARHDATPGQIALAWLLWRSPVILPIPGTSSVAHLEENTAAASLELDEEELATLA